MAHTPRSSREFDVIVYGATGYTGQLVAEYLHTAYSTAADAPRWAMAGRSRDKLAAARDAIGAPAELPLIVADADDAGALAAMAARTRCVLTTVGPYQLYGDALVAACVATGTDYVDLCGEPAWMADKIVEHHDAAKASGARIVFSCGFDSIPFDLGVRLLQDAAADAGLPPAPRVKGRVRSMVGTFSGGTAASLKATMAAAARDPGVIAKLTNPFALTPGFTGPAQPSGQAVEHDEGLGQWAAPFIMAPINTKNVHRTNALLGHAYGTDFAYDEMILTGPDDAGRAVADHLAATPMIGTTNDPKPGEGPTREQREAGSYDILFVGEWPDGRRLATSVQGDRDPGYGSTSKMIAETALALGRELTDQPGGVWTPGAIGGRLLADRLAARAGLTFKGPDQEPL